MNLERAYTNLSKALTFPTISYADMEKIDKEAFFSFLAFLEKAYPFVHRTLSKTMINTFAPVFHWKSKSQESTKKKPFLLIAHYDVVPVVKEGWTHGAFSGHISEKNISGRGAIDDKNSLICLLETVETLLEEGYEPTRDLYLAFGFDEEVGGRIGAGEIASYFKEKGITFEMVLDEGGVITKGSSMGIEKDIAVIGLAEKGNTNLELVFTGEDGHSSMPPKDSSIAKMAAFIHAVENNPRKPRLVEPVLSMLKAIAPYKKGIEAFVMKRPELFSSLIISSMSKGKQTAPMLKTTVAFTITNSGSAANVLPKQASCVANIRILPNDTTEEIIAWLRSFGFDFEIKPLALEDASRCSKTDSESFSTLKESILKVFPDVVVSPYLMIGGTDSRRYEEVAENVYRFMPCRLSPEDLKGMHGTNEFISKENVENMLRFYQFFIQNMNQ